MKTLIFTLDCLVILLMPQPRRQRTIQYCWNQQRMELRNSIDIMAARARRDFICSIAGEPGMQVKNVGWDGSANAASFRNSTGCCVVQATPLSSCARPM